MKRPARRGTAEIELLLSVLVLISILLLVLGGAKIGLARLDAVESVANKALGNAATGSTPLYTGSSDLDPVETVADVRPGLPNRTHVATSVQTVQVYAGAGEKMPKATVKAYSGAISPAWTMAGYPAVGDEQTMQAWFEDFVSESHVELIDPLILAPAWKP